MTSATRVRSGGVEIGGIEYGDAHDDDEMDEDDEEYEVGGDGVFIILVRNFSNSSSNSFS